MSCYDLGVREYMGGSLFGTKEWRRHFSIVISYPPPFPWRLDFLQSECPFNPGKRICKTHFAFLAQDELFGKPLTVERWFRYYSSDSKAIFGGVPNNFIEKGFYQVGEETLRCRWHLMLKNPSPKSFGDPCPATLVGFHHRGTSLIEEVTKEILLHLKNGKRASRSIFSKTASVAVMHPEVEVTTSLSSYMGKPRYAVSKMMKGGIDIKLFPPDTGFKNVGTGARVIWPDEYSQ